MIKKISFLLIPIAIFLITSTLISDFHNIILITLILTAIIFWATTLIPEYQTALYFLFGASFFSLASKDVIFSGFYSSAFWLVFAGMIITIAIKKLNLDSKFLKIFNKFSVNSYLKLLILITLFTSILCFIIPSSLSRIFITIPILNIICSNFGYEKNSKAYQGIILIGILTNTLTGFTILPSNLPNMILSGLTENIYNFKLYYSSYLISNFLIFGFIKSIILIYGINRYYAQEPKENFYESTDLVFNKKEKVSILILFSIILFWITDSFHGLSPSFIAIVGVLLLVHPSLGLIDTKDLNSVSFPTLIFVAGLIGLGNILVSNSFAKESIESLISYYDFSSNSSFINYMIITISTALSGIFLIQPSIPTLFTPFAQELSQLTDYSLNEVFMMQVASFSNIFFAHQSPPLIIGMQLAQMKLSKLFKPLFYVAIITTIFLYPLHYYWLSFLR